MKRNYEVVVGNIGTVHSGASRNAARKVYAITAMESRGKYGRASGEPVTLIQDGDTLVSAKRGLYDIPIYDDGFGPLYVHQNSIGISGIVRAQTWEDAYGICEDEFFPEADETVEQLKKEYGFRCEYKKVMRDNSVTVASAN